MDAGLAVSSDGVSWVRGAGQVQGARGAGRALDVGRVLEPNGDWWWFDVSMLLMVVMLLLHMRPRPLVALTGGPHNVVLSNWLFGCRRRRCRRCRPATSASPTSRSCRAPL